MDTTATEKLVIAKLSEIASLKGKYQIQSSSECLSKLAELENKLLNYRTKLEKASFDGIKKSEVNAYKTIFGVLADILPSTKVAKETMEKF